MNFLFYVVAGIMGAAAIGYFLPRLAVIAGILLLFAGLYFILACVYHELIITTPHDTSAYGMMATISVLTLIPMGLAMLVTGFIRKKF